MHELHLLKSLLKDVLAHARSNNLRKVSRVNLRMGEFTEINPEILKSYFKVEAQHTPAQDAEINIEASQARELRLVSIDGE